MKNKKLMISLFSLCLVAIVGLLATIIVLTATSQTISSKITLTYKATEVSGKLTAMYQLGDGDETQIGFGQFSAGDGSDALGSMDTNLTITSEKQSVVLSYKIENTGGSDMSAVISDDFTTTAKSNLTIEYSVGGENYGVKGEGYTSTKIEPNSTKSFYVRITMVDAAKNVNLKGHILLILENVNSQSGS